MPNRDDEEAKEIIKKAIKEWMDERFAELGRYTFYGFLAAMFGLLMYLVMVADGWHK